MTSKKINNKFHLILDAAVKIFAENGYHGSQVSKIAREAGVADGTIYLYFKNKEDILVSLFRERLGELVGKFKESVEASSTADEALRKICEIHYTELEQNTDLAYVTQIELRQSSLELRKAIGQAVKPYIQLIEAVLVKGMEEGTFRQGLDVKLTRLLIFGAMDEAVTSWLISGRKYSLSKQIEPTVEFFLKALKP
ncbi:MULTISPECIES: TetR/AcrR family transcriptional regulator [Paenibacillus]|uniref:TetR/AcrR family transcriptional regulator n=1 Tax=Paenibacillus TaxID=44249 RepID=UPI00087ED7C3|nr:MULTISPECIES: TetR/AcrR family transcriptional regulator [Paenibacillus]NTZ20005.1 TetR/AcrR family transcriptional regulator [Paenibacillus sp. JMULE4]GCL72178.1 TetR family transcriptional regulator [Paenibacillus naphthalenovorans]SDI92285.1 TetR/AcrR family transcriptional regulator, fatty acid metabolism regulator protein [Paenibacillus naphthalenovorans]